MLKYARLFYNKLYRLIQPKFRLIHHKIQNVVDKKKDAKILYCIGDSHNEIFEYINKKHLLSLKLRCVTVQGATIFGLANPNSKTNSLPIFKNELLNAPRESYITILLGEIDCGFLIWTRAEKNNTTIEHEMLESIHRYKDFILWIKHLSFKKIIIISVPPQTISDDNKAGEVANARMSVTASLAKRTKLTRQYNNILKVLAEEMNIDFLDMDNKIIDSVTGNVHKHLLNNDPRNHHLNTLTASPMYAEKLKLLIP